MLWVEVLMRICYLMMVFSLLACEKNSEKPRTENPPSKTEQSPPNEDAPYSEDLTPRIPDELAGNTPLNDASQSDEVVRVIPLTYRTVTATGTGCRENETLINRADDESAVTVGFSSFLVESPQTLKNQCQLQIEFDLPLGWQVIALSLGSRGFAELDQGSQVRLTSRLLQSGARKQEQTSLMNGPLNADFQFLHRFQLPPLASCGGDKSFSFSVDLDFVRGSNNSGFVAIDSLDSTGESRIFAHVVRCSL